MIWLESTWLLDSCDSWLQAYQLEGLKDYLTLGLSTNITKNYQNMFLEIEKKRKKLNIIKSPHYLEKPSKYLLVLFKNKPIYITQAKLFKIFLQ